MYHEAWGVLDGSGLDVAPAFGSPSACFVVAVTVSLLRLSEISYPVPLGSLGRLRAGRLPCSPQHWAWLWVGRAGGAVEKPGPSVCSAHVLAYSKKVILLGSADLLAFFSW